MLRKLSTWPATHDVDVLEADAAVQSVLSRYPALNGAVAAYADEIAWGFEDRLERVLPDTRVIAWLVPSLEDLVVMKLFACRPPDIADLTSPKMLAALDWNLLEHLVRDEGEARSSVLSERRYREMVAAYHRYRGEYGPCV